VWKGSISFGLVNVPVRAFTAARDHEVHFNQLERETGARVRYEKVSGETGKAVDADDIELGYEIRPGRYVTFERGEIDDLRPESTRSVVVSDFVDLDQIDPVYYERSYWLAPDGDAATEAYRLLAAAMADRDKVAIGTVVMRNKQYLAAIRPVEGALVMSTMRFADEVVSRSDIEGLPSGRAKADAKALKLAGQIIDSLSADWQPKQYHDTYTEQLRSIIERKDKGEEVVEEAAPATSAPVLDLMAALERSVTAAKSGRRGGEKCAGTTKASRSATRSGSSKGTGTAKASGSAKASGTARKSAKAKQSGSARARTKATASSGSRRSSARKSA
jgi:DNA end-binding protein Ku